MRTWVVLVEGLHDSQMRGKRWDESEDQKATLQISVVSLAASDGGQSVSTLALQGENWA